jgi:hypothetical protein
MTLDPQASLITYIYNLLTTDATLISNMGGTVRLSLTWAPPDCAFPYLVNRIDMSNVSDYSPIRRGTFYIDIWSDSPSASEALIIRKRLMELLDNLTFSTAEVDSVAMWRQTDGFVPESTEGIWHYAIQMNMRITVLSDVSGTIYR